MGVFIPFCFMQHTIGVVKGLNSGSIDFTLKIAQSAREIRACVGCSILETTN